MKATFIFASKAVKASGLTKGLRRVGKTDRIDIKSPGLCDDIITYFGPSLEQYKNCDIIDANPGDGLWSSKIHEFLKPRRHVLLESEKQYTPFLKPLLDAPGSKYVHVPYNGSAPRSFVDVFQEGHLPNQVPLNGDDPRINQPNTTLLVLLNLTKKNAKSPRTSYFLNRHLLNTLQTNAWSHTGIHQYGLIRMLVWCDDYTKERLIPKDLSGDSFSLSFQHTTDTHLIAERYPPELSRHGTDLDLASAVRAAESMRRLGMKLPQNRSNFLHHAALDLLSTESNDAFKRYQDVENELRSRFIEKRDALEELEALEAEFKAGTLTMPQTAPNTKQLIQDPRWGRLESLRNAASSALHNKRMNHRSWEPTLAIGERMLSLERLIIDESKSDAERLAAKQEWENTKKKFRNTWRKLGTTRRRQALLAFDQRKAFYWLERPLLMWDRRPFEPLATRKNEFHPQTDMALLDINPKPAPGERSERDSLYWQRFAMKLSSRTTSSIKAALNDIYLGAADALLPEIGLVHDPKQGGSIDIEEVRVRNLTPEMVEEIVDAYRRWIFRPDAIEVQLTEDRLNWEDLANSSSAKQVFF
ncbi:uncharacterized protein K452DRAFT_316534 [Aplosporella prunicola CBS 121167]|uniref:Mitochondrial transcription factor 1 n=1 Tax=Aplosporella prunicola CBS 121167 TaxID=1176127 RepID=A0A6A6BK94_9PEZI|nr:uncharacterized protein K452DRAFT_316534 [Aplosporella prunicola CBS 121167]KAF2144560.1 hypothetical protein K452DRAFT_316534 [Aplosporella prunicola CBS 121167]